MAVRRVLRSSRSLQRQAREQFLSGFESGAFQSSSQTRHPRNISNQYLSSLNLRDKVLSSSRYVSIVQERCFTVPSRCYVTSYKREEKGSPSTSTAPLETSSGSASAAPGTEGASVAQPGNETLVSETPSVNVSVDSAFKSSPRHDMAMLFTCTVCNTRSAKTMSRATYETGVVIVRCPGCQNLHLIADRYGWFGEPGSVEDFLAEKGIDVRKGSDGSYEFSVDDMSGWTPKERS